MDINWIDWFGYAASLVILVSLTMTSIIKLRWINFVGCILFAMFGLLIKSYPTAIMNIGISFINIFYLYNIYKTKEEFKLIEADTSSPYFKHFIEVNKKDIEKQINEVELQKQNKGLYMLRNNNIAGILLGEKNEEGTFFIKVDFVTSQYRDYKLGNYFYNEHTEYLESNGINKLITIATEQSHKVYLKKVGFREIEENKFMKEYN
ncbi:MAG: YgjV family protein [Psychrilyobacter sp.]|nr:YgjV family protein [Psychrilyobacter sp.]